jgi:hypothetical protein
MDTPNVHIPAKARFGLYVLTGVTTPVIAYLASKGYIGDLEVALWAAEATFASAVAASNVTKRDKFIP